MQSIKLQLIDAHEHTNTHHIVSKFAVEEVRGAIRNQLQGPPSLFISIMTNNYEEIVRVFFTAKHKIEIRESQRGARRAVRASQGLKIIY